MPLSKPLQVFAFRFSDEERALLEAKAAQRNLTLSAALREGLALYCEDARVLVADGGTEAGAAT